MEAIDYKKLLREERRRARKGNDVRGKTVVTDKMANHKVQKTTLIRTQQTNKEAKVQAFNTFSFTNWNYPDGFLTFHEMSLEEICDNPKSICYSPKALETQNTNYPLEPTNSDKIRSSISKPRTLASPEEALSEWLRDIRSGDSGFGEWKTMNYGKRRVCVFGEETGDTLPTPLAEIARELVNQGVFPASSPPNHVLLNEYQAGQGILPHTDGPLYDDRTATLSLGSDVVIEFTKRLTSSEIGVTARKITNNCNSETNQTVGNNCDLNQASRASNNDSSCNDSQAIQILLESGSLLLFQGDAYVNYCHGIQMDILQDETTCRCLNAPPGVVVDRAFRYSLTFRRKRTQKSL